MTFVSCAQAIAGIGGRPIFCDIEAETVAIDIADVMRCVSPRTRAVMPVHYAGFPCRLDELVELARKHGFAVVEDAAHAFGSTYKDRMIGSVGDLTCFSFDPVKNITCGEGGAVTTNNDELARRVRLWRNLGVSRATRPGRVGDEPPVVLRGSAPGLQVASARHQRCNRDAQLDRVRRARAESGN